MLCTGAKIYVVLESNLCFGGGWGKRMGSTDTRTEKGEKSHDQSNAGICRNVTCRGSFFEVYTRFSEVFLPEFH